MGAVCCEGCERMIKELKGESFEIEAFVIKKTEKEPAQTNQLGHHGQNDSLRVTHNSQQQEITIRNTLLAPQSQNSILYAYPSLSLSGKNWQPYVPSPIVMPEVPEQKVDLSHPFFMRSYGKETKEPVVKKPVKRPQSYDDRKQLRRSSVGPQPTQTQTFNPIKSAI